MWERGIENNFVGWETIIQNLRNILKLKMYNYLYNWENVGNFVALIKLHQVCKFQVFRNLCEK